MDPPTLLPDLRTEEGLLALIDGAQPRMGSMPFWAVGGLLLAWPLSVIVATVSVGAVVIADVGLDVLWFVAPAIVLTLVIGPWTLWVHSMQKVQREWSTVLASRRAADPRLGHAGELVDVIRARTAGDPELQRRLSRIEARLHRLVDDERRLLASARPSAEAEAVQEVVTKQIEEVLDRLTGLHARTIDGLDLADVAWLAAEQEIAGLEHSVQSRADEPGLAATAARRHKRPQ